MPNKHTAQTLSPLNIAALLVSASYGIGFLFGSGELALSHGMAGSIYAISTAIGMLALACFAGYFWTLGAPLWEMFKRFNQRTRQLVALISAIWMLGILAAQIHGGAAALQLLHINQYLAYSLVCGLILLASYADLKKLGLLFSLLLLAASCILIFLLLKLSASDVYLQAIPQFLVTLKNFSLSQALIISITTIMLVIMGADYQQFIVGADSKKSAVTGCLLAALILVVVGFLPASVVIAAQQNQLLPMSLDGKQSIPFLISWAVGGQESWLGKMFLTVLLLTALGAGSAITRAIVAASKVALQHQPSDLKHTSELQKTLPLSVISCAYGLTLIGSTMVDLIVTFNLIYLATLAVPIACCVLRINVSASAINRCLLSGLFASCCAQIYSRFTAVDMDLNIMTLSAGLLASSGYLLLFNVHSNWQLSRQKSI